MTDLRQTNPKVMYGPSEVVCMSDSLEHTTAAPPDARRAKELAVPSHQVSVTRVIGGPLTAWIRSVL
jgi:hypothetical protein